MENPASWTLAEHIIDRAIQKHEELMSQSLNGVFIAGGSQAMAIATALRDAGLLKPYDSVDALGFGAFDAGDILSYVPVPDKVRPAPKPFVVGEDELTEEAPFVS